VNKGVTRLAGIATVLMAVAGIVFFALEMTPQRLGFQDTDDPALMVRFIREHPEVFAQSGVILVMMAIFVTVAVLAVAEALGPTGGGLTLRITSAFGLFSSAFFLFGGGIRVGSSAPLLHMARLAAATGEAAYVAAQVVSQAIFNGGLVALSLWAVGISVVGYRSRVLPVALCALGALPGFRLVSSLLGPVGLLPEVEVLWLIAMVSILGTFLWFLLLGLVLLRRGLRSVTSAPGSDVAGIPEVATPGSW
jgi:Domain of unknown function (DUF4386)